MKTIKYHKILPMQPSKIKMLLTRLTYLRNITQHTINNSLDFLDTPGGMFQKWTTLE